MTFIDKLCDLLNVPTTEDSFNEDSLFKAITDLQKAKELAQLAAEGHSEDLTAIAAQLGVGFNGDVQTIFRAIHRLKLRTVKDESERNRANDLLGAIANALGFEYVDSPQSKDVLLGAIANLKKDAKFDDAWRKRVSDIYEKGDRDELQSERNHYRSILDKLCDRLNAPNIEALEHIAKYQEMDLDFTSQHNDDLREKLASSQAMSLKYMNRIVELENELRSLREPLPEMMQQFLKGDTVSIGDVLNRRRCDRAKGAEINDRDRLSEAELVQIVRSLLPRLN